MPVLDTKYNYITQFQTDISNSSFEFNRKGHIITCDVSDTVIDASNTLYKRYLISKAEFLMHPFSRQRNCETDLVDQDSLKTNPKIQCHSCQDISSSINEIQIQKKIQNQLGVHSSLFSMNLASLHVGNEISNNNFPARFQFNQSDRLLPHGIKRINAVKTSIKPNYGVDIKHGSYDRYLNRKKSQYLKTENKNLLTNQEPKWGNKTQMFGLINRNCIKNC